MLLSPDGSTLYTSDLFTENLRANNARVTTGTIVADDADGDSLEYTVTTAPAHGTVDLDPTTGAWTYNSYPGVSQSDSFVVTVSDGHGGTVDVPVTMSNNSAPTATSTITADGQSITSNKLVHLTPSSDYNGLKGVALSPDGGRAYVVNNAAAGAVYVIDTQTESVIATIPVGNNPQAIVMVPDGTKAYVTNYADGTISVIDTGTNSVITTIAGNGYASGLASSPDGSRVYAITGNTLNVIDTDTDTVITTIPVSGDPRAIAVSRDGDTVYVVGWNTRVVTVVDTATNQTRTFPIGDFASAAATSNDGTKLYLANYGSGTVTVIDTATGTVIDTIDVPGGPTSLAASKDGSALYVVGDHTAAITTIDAATDTVIGTTTLPRSGRDITVSPDGTTIYTTDVGNQNLTSVKGPATSGRVVGSDPDGDTLTYEVTSTPTHGTVSLNPATGEWMYLSSTAAVAQSDSFIVTVSDGRGGTVDAVVAVNTPSAV